MASASGWYDPVCYQFVIYALSNVKTEPSIIDAFQEFVYELAPFYALWLSMNGSIWRKQQTVHGSRMTSITNAETLNNREYWKSTASDTEDGWEIILLPGKTLANFAASSRDIPRFGKSRRGVLPI